ncbi:MAG TPA: DUF1501 domain-containing protein [Planctomycetaceae bacterium]|nr:DUF1501 domain-containing protein [Planctomycetaceae bacterium]
MLSLYERSNHRSGDCSRREWMRIGGLNALGLSLPALLAKTAEARGDDVGAQTFGRAKNVIYLYLAGGPPQHETFDPKPDAPAEVRGEFQPIHTNVPGIDFCELLPRTSTIADKLAICRSMATDDNTHSTSGYWVLTGFKYRGTNAREISPTDWPHIGSVVQRLKPSANGPFGFAWLPEPIVANPGVRISGQTAGFIGRRWDPHNFTCDPQRTNFSIEEFALPDDVPPLRVSSRASLLKQINHHFQAIEQHSQNQDISRLRAEALDILTTGKARQAFALEREPAKLRDRYGRGKWGQSVLLARRLIEAGVRFVHVQWPREPGDLTSSAPTWDTHAKNNARVKSVLCPQFDVAFSALIDDLDSRGLLDETLVVAGGEFGRTPTFNAQGGRDHWGPVFSVALAGAGISGGQVYGSSDAKGAYPRDGRTPPQDLAATIFHLLGTGHNATMPHPNGRPIHICDGKPMYSLLGLQPATQARRAATGKIEPIPDFLPIYTPQQNT